ncbi:hypothetical protein FA95DRAFT_1576621 [Auriscalpium vulgare]|uniref:Uncharacterized protein n=1 Tax=Auriscalpium vulgare TaxID=40419 RepID=A0ACB8RBK5_9AGAM|nr:hypothetical protein FA95DRAFT_1576621 [Auriscalpium vulgare]
MAEEVRNPAHELSRAMVYTVPIGMVMGLVFLLLIVFTLPDIGTLLSGNACGVVSSGQLIAVMFALIMGNNAGRFALVSISMLHWFITLPYPSLFLRLSRPAGADAIPLYAFLLSTTIQLLLGLLHLGSSAAFNGFVAVAVVCLGASNALPVAVSLARGRHYASVIFVGFALFSAVWYWIDGRHHYVGPPVPQDNDGSETESMGRGENVGSIKPPKTFGDAELPVDQ